MPGGPGPPGPFRSPRGPGPQGPPGSPTLPKSQARPCVPSHSRYPFPGSLFPSPPLSLVVVSCCTQLSTMFQSFIPSSLPPIMGIGPLIASHFPGHCNADRNNPGPNPWSATVLSIDTNQPPRSQGVLSVRETTPVLFCPPSERRLPAL